MSVYVGDYTANATVRFAWGTYSAAGASVARTTDGNVRIYKNANATYRSSTSGVTDTKNFNSVVGSNMLTIDLSNNADAGFYAEGNDYSVVIVGAVVDGQTRNIPLCNFSITNRDLRPLAMPVTTPLGTSNTATVIYGVDATLPSRAEILQDATRNPIDLTYATAIVYTLTSLAGVPKVAASAVFVDKVTGSVRYDWSGSDLDTVGDYRERWEVTMPTGTLIVSGPIIKVI